MRGDLPALVEAARTGLAAIPEPDAPPGEVRLRVPLPGGRSQSVRVTLEEDTLRFATRCGDAPLARQHPGLYRALLRKNATLKHGFFALAADGGIELVATQLLATCDPEEFTTLLQNLAAVGDFLEQELAKGLPGAGLDLY